MLFMLMTFYRVRDAEVRLRNAQARSGPPQARMLKGKTEGIIGYGNPEVGAHLGTIARDVFTTEPLPPGSLLRDLPDTILTNHDAAHTQQSLGALFDLAVGNIRVAMKGRPLLTRLPLP